MTIKRTTLAMVAVASILGACGGGESGSANTENNGALGGGAPPPPPLPPPPAPTPSLGVFIDSAVAGIHYATATQSGETDAEGRFKYLPGETVTFSIGGVQLPPVAASDVITPLMVFETNDFTDQRAVNLGRLLQSLDDDGNLDNGIQITEQARTAATGLTLDFAVPPATFEANAAVTNLLANGGGSVTLVSAEDAVAHMQEQAAQNGLSLVGAWSLQDGDELVTLTFFPDGKYMLAEDAVADDTGQAGYEFGTYAWNPVSGALTIETTAESNGEWGLSHPQGQQTITRDGDNISLVEKKNAEVLDDVTLKRVVDPDNAIVGTWTPDDQEPGKRSVFVFLPNGHFTLAETGTAEEDGGPGIEHGTYTWNPDTSAFAVGQMLANTNGDWGISDQTLLTAEVEGNTMTATFTGGDVVTLTRVP